MAACIPATVKQRFPELFQSFARLPDSRKPQGRQYGMKEIMTGGLSLFLFKSGSRNQLNNNRQSGHFEDHYRNLFGMKLPHQDTVSDVLRELDPAKLNQCRMDLMSGLFNQKCLRGYRLLDQYYTVAVDATGIVSYDSRHCEHCLTKKSKSGKVTYFHYVLEAKLVTKDGHALSLASEWIENNTGEFVKQDCERKAFVRLAAKLKKQYPRLPVCILADGLYPYENAFKICEDYGWKFIFVLQDKSLKTVREELTLTLRSKPVEEFFTVKNGWRITDEFRYQAGIQYHEKYTLNWMQCIENRKKIIASKQKTPLSQTEKEKKEEPSRFEYVTNILPDRENIRELCAGGRLRWKVENEGFNTQKNNGYELEHKYCEKSYAGMQNYYALLQIAHAISQFIEKGALITGILKMRPKETITNLWKNLKGYMIFCIPVMAALCAEIENLLRPAPS